MKEKRKMKPLQKKDFWNDIRKGARGQHYTFLKTKQECRSVYPTSEQH